MNMDEKTRNQIIGALRELESAKRVLHSILKESEKSEVLIKRTYIFKDTITGG